MVTYNENQPLKKMSIGQMEDSELVEVTQNHEFEHGAPEQQYDVSHQATPREGGYFSKPKKDFSNRRHLGCVVTKSRTPWCRGVCKYDENNLGQCGRLAAHSMKSRLQIAMEEYAQKQKQSVGE